MENSLKIRQLNIFEILMRMNTSQVWREKDVYLVEWRQGVKEPKGGWPVYEASIFKIAGAFFFLSPI